MFYKLSFNLIHVRSMTKNIQEKGCNDYEKSGLFLFE